MRLSNSFSPLTLTTTPTTTQAKQVWSEYLLWNRSFVVDLFQGQYRSSTQCLGCGFRSTTFNPFTCLSLPLPYKKRCISVIVHFHRDEKSQKQPHHYKLLVPQRGAVGELKEILAKACGVSRSRLVSFGVSSNSSVLRVTYVVFEREARKVLISLFHI